jgi:sporulation protein YlmC with PRC-barrel domain
MEKNYNIMDINENHKTTYLEELSDTDFEISDHQPDINGWEIIDSLGNEIGEVKDLIIDTNALKVRYIVADLDFSSDEQLKVGAKVVLIPIGVVDLDDDNEEVILKDFSASQLSVLPIFESGKTISPVEEVAVRYAFLGENSLPHAESVVYDTHPDDFYTHRHFDVSRYIREKKNLE